MALQIPRPFADPFSGLASGIESGVGIGLSLRRQRQTEDAQEFSQLQDQLETKKVEKERKTNMLEKELDFHIKTKNIAAARDSLVAIDEIAGTNFSKRVPEERLAEFNERMKALDKADPSIQDALTQRIIKDYPVFSTIGQVAPAKRPDLFAKEGVSKFTPESVAKAEKSGLQSDLRVRTEAAGGVSEVQSSKILPGGLTQLVFRNGSVKVVPATEADAILVRDAEARGASLQGLRAGERKGATEAVKAGAKAFEKLLPIKTTIRNIDNGIRLLDQGAKTGAVQGMLPSITAASKELDNVQAQMGLDVIGNTTFGALSESELKFALSSALPKGLNEPELKAWLERKREAQSNLAQYLEETAIFLNTPGNNIADFLKQKRSTSPKTTGAKRKFNVISVR